DVAKASTFGGREVRRIDVKMRHERLLGELKVAPLRAAACTADIRFGGMVELVNHAAFLERHVTGIGNRASDPRVRAQIGEGGEDQDELARAEAAVRRERERGVALDVFLHRAVLAAGGTVERHDNALRIATPPALAIAR